MAFESLQITKVYVMDNSLNCTQNREKSVAYMYMYVIALLPVFEYTFPKQTYWGFLLWWKHLSGL